MDAPQPFLFDADAHVLEPPDLWDTYLEPRFRDRSIQFRRNDKGADQLFVDNQLILPNCTAALGGAELDRNRAMDPRSHLGYLDGAPPSSMFGPERVALFDRWGLSAGLVLSTIGIFWDTPDDALANAYCRAHNDWVRDFQAAQRAGAGRKRPNARKLFGL